MCRRPRILPGIPDRSNQFRIASPAATDAVPNRWCPQACPAPTPSRSSGSGTAAWLTPGSASELREDADHRTARAPFGDEPGRHSRHPGFHCEAAGGELLLEETGTLLLLVPHFRPVPDAERHLLEIGALGIQEL